MALANTTGTGDTDHTSTGTDNDKHGADGNAEDDGVLKGWHS